jgi:hypothetical protein
MRKKSHIRLGKYLLDNIECENKRKSFIFGNILPDCVPTFIYVKHNIENTIGKVEKLLNDVMSLKQDTYRFWIKMGCIAHYIADYFTYPHTKIFHGNFFEHNSYEKELKDTFKDNLNKLSLKDVPKFKNIHELVVYIKEKQVEYFNAKENASNPFLIDTDYIFNVNRVVFLNVLNLRMA